MELKGKFISVQREAGARDPGAFRMSCELTGHPVTCEGIGWELKKGMPVLVTGEWENEALGIFRADEVRFDLADRERCVKFFQKSGFQGMGVVKAGLVYQDLMKEAESRSVEPDELTEEVVSGILSRHSLEPCKQKFLNTYLSIAIRKQIKRYFGNNPVRPKDVESIYKAYGAQFQRELEKDPYASMMAGLSYQLCDQLAWRLHPGDAWNKKRMEAAFEQMSNRIYSDGSCCIRVREAVSYISHLFRESPYGEMPESVIFLELLASPKFMVRQTEDYGAVIYPKFLYYVEQGIVTEIRRLNHSGGTFPFTGYHGDSNLDPDQEKAIGFLHSGGVKILHGGPGAGKTTVIRAFIDEYRQMEEDASVLLCAPTGRAAARISESCGGDYKAYTIHKLLGVKPYEPFLHCKRDSDNPLPKGLFILDEMSMVDELLFLRFLQAIPSGSLVILSGDPDQLPSVQSGTVLRDLISSGMLEAVRLNGNHRQKGGGTIYANYKKVCARDIHLTEDDQFVIQKVSTKEELLDMVRKEYETYYTDNPADFQILTTMRKGDLGSLRINRMISELRGAVDEETGGYYGYQTEVVNGVKHRVITRKGSFSVGDRIIMLVNNYEKGYWNGDTGVIQRILPTGEYEVQFYDETRLIDTESSYDMEHAFALTVHKSQGAEYKAVTLILDSEHANMLYHSMFLTAMTRAKEHVTILSYGEDCVAKAIRTDREALRITGLREQLQEGLEQFSKIAT